MARGATSIFCNAKSVRRQPTFSPLDKSRRVFLFVFLSLIVLSSTCAIFYIGTHIQAVNLGYKMSQELQLKEELIEENKRLNLDIARLKSPTRIESEAKDTLGLALPKTQQVFYLSRLEDDTLVKIAGAAPLPAAAKPNPVETVAKAPTPEKTPVVAAKNSPEKSKAAPKKTPVLAETPRDVPTTVAKAPTALAKRSAKETGPNSTEKMPEAIKALALQAKVPGTKVKTKALETKPAVPEKNIALAAKEPAAKKAPETKNEKATKPVATVAEKAAVSPKSDLALPKEKPAAVAQKNDPVKTPPAKSSAKEKPQDLRVAKRGGDQVLVAKIVDKETSREKGVVKLKGGTSVAYQPKEKVPAVMLDPIP